MTDIPDNVLDEIEAALRSAAFVLSGFELSCSAERDAHSALAKLRAAKASSAISITTMHHDLAMIRFAEAEMREAAASVARRFAKQNKEGAVILRRRQHAQTGSWNANELDSTAAEAEAIAVEIEALSLTKETGK